MKFTEYKPDTIGVLASTLCVLHCIATPLLFIAQAGVAHTNTMALSWWRSLDYVFLAISFFAVYRATHVSSKKYMKVALWSSWSALAATILNEKLELFPIPEVVIYAVTIVLIVLHLYNLNYCQCKTDHCCTTDKV